VETFAERLTAVPFNQRHELLQAHVREKVAQVLGFSAPDQLDPQQGFFKSGMDSVMAVQLRLLLETSLACPLPTTVAFEYPTVETMTVYLANEVLGLVDSLPQSAAALETNQKVDEVDTLAGLSEDELLAMFDNELVIIDELVEGDRIDE
jgi:acyl carrier protein